MVPEQAVLLLVQDNLDIACTAIEKAAMERAVSDVDEGFAASYDVRRRHREVSPVHKCTQDSSSEMLFRQIRNGQAFWDPSAPHSSFSVTLPEPLQIKANGLQQHQAGVYEDFGELPSIYVPLYTCSSFISHGLQTQTNK